MSRLKVHFAGAEQAIEFIPAQRFSKVNYSLLTAFPYVCSCLGIKPPSLYFKKHLGCEYNLIPRLLTRYNKHVILDSGLFTLMFGAHAQKREKKEIEIYFNHLIEFIQTSIPINGYSCVEIDCQKILGVKEAWEFREKMKQMLPGRSIMNVWHLDDGLYGLDKITEFSDYICLSIPELRIHLKNQMIPAFTNKLCNRIRKRKPDIKIHLLGCTQKNINLINKDIADSCDSTGWQQPFRFGGNKIIERKISMYGRNKEDLTHFEAFLPQEFSSAKDDRKVMECIGRWSLSMSHFKKKYEEYLGVQN